MAKTTDRAFTGRHAAIWLVCFFGVVIAVNMVMMRLAGSTFGGVVVENSYVASQEFNGWLDEAATEKKLGWNATAKRGSGDRVSVNLNGAPATAVLEGEARHPLGKLPDVRLHFARRDDGTYVSGEAVPAGRWTLRLEARSGKDRWRAEQDFW